MSKIIHASCVAVAGRGVLLLGDSGAGKSDMALRLIDAGAHLISDDQVVVRADGGQLLASPPEKLAGLLELRGIGVLRLPFETDVPLAMAVNLEPGATTERLPGPDAVRINRISLQTVTLNPLTVSAPAKIRAYLTYPAAEGAPVDHV